MEQILSEIKTLGKKYHAQKVVLFGSRARGDNHPRSDIDIAVWGITSLDKALFWNDIEELHTLLNFDIVHIEKGTDTELLKNIEKDGIIIYENQNQ